MTAPESPQRGRLVSWAGFVFGSVTSIAANVLHTWLPAAHEPPGWSPGIAPQVGAAVWPIGLLLSVEVLSRARWQSGRLWALARYGGAGAVAVGSAIISYSHLRDVLLTWGYGPLAAGVGPLTLDGLMVVSGFALLSMTLARETSTTGESVSTPAPAPSEPALSAEPADLAAVSATEAPSSGDRSPVPDSGHHPATQAPAPATGQDSPAPADPAEEDTGAPTRRDSARALSARGWTQARIATELGVSKRTVRRYLSTPAVPAVDPTTAPDTDLNDRHTLAPSPDAAALNHHQPLEGVLV